MLQIAKILKSNGTDGGILIGMRDISASEINLKEPVFIEFDGLPVPFFIQDLQERCSSKAVVHLNDITSLRDAEEVVGRAVYAEGECEEESEEDFTDWTLYNRDSLVGKISGLEPIPGNPCIYVGDTLIPLHEDFVLCVDEDSKTLVLSLPDGLL